MEESDDDLNDFNQLKKKTENKTAQRAKEMTVAGGTSNKNS